MPADVIVQQGNETGIGQSAAGSSEVEDGKCVRLSALGGSKSESAGIARANGVRGAYSPVICFRDGFGQYIIAEHVELCEFTFSQTIFCVRMLSFHLSFPGWRVRGERAKHPSRCGLLSSRCLRGRPSASATLCFRWRLPAMRMRADDCGRIIGGPFGLALLAKGVAFVARSPRQHRLRRSRGFEEHTNRCWAVIRIGGTLRSGFTGGSKMEGEDEAITDRKRTVRNKSCRSPFQQGYS
jgi:hypothetical protein